MEIFELLFASADACGCFVQILAAVLDISAGVRGYQVSKRIQQRKTALRRGEEPPPRPLVWPFVVLLLAAVFCTGLAVLAWLRPGR